VSSTNTLRRRVLDGLRAGRPTTGPLQVHVDVTNGCNAACVTCWDHSPLLDTPRPPSWKRQRLPLPRFRALVDDLVGFGSVQAVVISGMGEPLTHPDVYDMLALVKAQGWHLTLLSNLVAADADRLGAIGVDNLLVGVHGASPDVYAAFHPGWSEQHFFTMCRHMRRLARAGTRLRHVQVIDRHTAPEVVDMVRFGKLFSADRVNYKLASLAEGTQAVIITDEQAAWLVDEGIPAARALAAHLQVHTNLDLFERQVRAHLGSTQTTTPMDEVGCAMGHVYTRVTVTGDVLYCCNPAVRVGSLDDAPISALWSGPRWQALRERIARHDWFPGCERCGKFEQNVKWRRRLDDSTAAS